MSIHENLRWVGIYRTSTNLQSEKSIPDQQKLVLKYANENGMISAGHDLIQSGVSATRRRGREDLDDLIQRKTHENDFDAVLVHDYSRLTRRGTKDAFQIEGKLNAHGIRVISATEMIPEGPYADTIKSVLHSQHNQYARDNAQRITRGQMSAIVSRRSVGPRMMSFGIDRLYTSLDGAKKHHILRLLQDGSQLRLHPETNEILDVYEQIKGGRSTFYRRQPNERVILVPGNPKHLDLVRRIFHLVVQDGMGYHSTARKLHLEGEDSPQLGAWSKSSIKRIVTNPIYTGRLISNRLSRAEYYKRSLDGPVTVPDEPIGYDQERKLLIRPEAEWVILDLPETADILDSKLREAAIAYQDQVLSHDAEMANRGIKRDKHTTTSFILKDVLSLKEDGSPMCGQIANQTKIKGKVYRYYRPRGYGAANNTGTTRNCRMSAEPLEAFVLDMLSRVFACAPGLRDKVREHVVRQQLSRHEAKTSLEELTKKRKNLSKKITCFADVGGDFDDEMVAKVAQMRSHLRDLDIRLKAASEEVVDGDPDAIADSVVAGLTDMGVALKTATPTVLRKILKVMVEKFECDPQTRQAWLTLRVPSWAMDRMGQLTMENVCLEYAPLQNCIPEANFRLAAAKMRTTMPYDTNRGSLNLDNYRVYITDGILASDVEFVPATPTTEGIRAAASADCGYVFERSPYPPKVRKKKVYDDKPYVDLVPYDWDAFDLGYQPIPLPWSFWHPYSIAA